MKVRMTVAIWGGAPPLLLSIILICVGAAATPSSSSFSSSSSCDDESMGHNAVNELAQLEHIWEITRSNGTGSHHRPVLRYEVQRLPLHASDGCLRWLITERAAAAGTDVWEVGGSSMLAEIRGEAMLRLCA